MVGYAQSLSREAERSATDMTWLGLDNMERARAGLRGRRCWMRHAALGTSDCYNYQYDRCPILSIPTCARRLDPIRLNCVSLVENCQRQSTGRAMVEQHGDRTRRRAHRNMYPSASKHPECGPAANKL